MSRRRIVIADERGGRFLTPSLVDRLRADIEVENGARFVTLEGGADAFCTGLHIGVLAESGGDRSAAGVLPELDRFAALLQAIDRSPIPVIALVDGPAIGGGVGLAAVADLVLATPRARFSLPEVFLGLIPATVFPYLARRVGISRARGLALFAASLSAAQALKIGLVDQVEEDLELALAGRTRRLLRAAPQALAEIKRLVADHHGVPADYGPDASARFAGLLEQPETKERLTLFAEGGSPWPDTATSDSARATEEP